MTDSTPPQARVQPMTDQPQTPPDAAKPPERSFAEQMWLAAGMPLPQADPNWQERALAAEASLAALKERAAAAEAENDSLTAERDALKAALEAVAEAYLALRAAEDRSFGAVVVEYAGRHAVEENALRKAVADATRLAALGASR